MYWSSLAAVRAWAEERLGVHVGTYPPANPTDDFGVVQRVGGEVDYPHDSPMFAIQIWADSEPDAEECAIALSRAIPTLMEAEARINRVGLPTLISLGRDEDGKFVWQLEFEINCNIRYEQEAN